MNNQADKLLSDGGENSIQSLMAHQIKQIKEQKE